MIDGILASVTATLINVAPIFALLAFFQLAILRRPLPRARRMLAGSLLVVVGIALFLVGLEAALFPLGRTMAAQLTDPEFLGLQGAAADWHDYAWIYLFAAAIGFATTIAEPALIAVALKANTVSAGAVPVWGLRLAVAFGVAVGVAVGCFRIVTGTPLAYYIIPGYIIVLTQAWFVPRLIVPIAFDSGGVTTSTVTVPVIAALGLGLASTIPGRDPLIDGFGLIAFANVFPIMSVLAYAGVAAAVARRRQARRE